MSRLVVVSNRVALPGENQTGGLAVALQSMLRERGGLWFGWSGKIVRHAGGTLHEQRDGNIRYVTMDLNRADHDAYYNGFSNRTLWPLLHFRLDLVDYDRGTRDGYWRVNTMFADRLAPMLREDDLVWVHDYHLIPLASILRERGIGCRIGFFLHVPMPSADLVAAMPDHARLFSSITAYDLVGFQTQRDTDRFLSYIRLFAGGETFTDEKLETTDGRRLRVRTFPVGVDTERIASQASTALSKPTVHALRTAWSIASSSSAWIGSIIPKGYPNVSIVSNAIYSGTLGKKAV
jgi:trehalose 6-phosphate synthase